MALQIDQAVAAITAAAPTSASPPELIARIERLAERSTPALRALRVSILALAIDTIADIEGGDAEPLDRDAADRLIANELISGAAFIVRSLKRRAGDDINPARFALVAFELAQQIADLPAWNDANELAEIIVAADAEGPE